jgi:hypothetical protein
VKRTDNKWGLNGWDKYMKNSLTYHQSQTQEETTVCYHPSTTAVENDNIWSIFIPYVPLQGTFWMGEGHQAQMQNQIHITKYISNNDNTLSEQICITPSKTYSCRISYLQS